MENLSNKQKIVLGIIAIFMLIVIGYYFMQKTERYDNLNMSEMVQEEPTVDLTEDENNNVIVVHIAGAIIEEGIVKIKEGSRIIDVINSAGGTKIDADLSNVNLAYIVQDGQKIHIPSIYDKEEELEIVSNSSGENVVIDGGILQSNGLVNINKSSQTELETLSGIRPINCFKDN